GPVSGWPRRFWGRLRLRLRRDTASRPPPPSATPGGTCRGDPESVGGSGALRGGTGEPWLDRLGRRCPVSFERRDELGPGDTAVAVRVQFGDDRTGPRPPSPTVPDPGVPQ